MHGRKGGRGSKAHRLIERLCRAVQNICLAATMEAGLNLTARRYVCFLSRITELLFHSWLLSTQTGLHAGPFPMLKKSLSQAGLFKNSEKTFSFTFFCHCGKTFGEWGRGVGIGKVCSSIQTHYERMPHIPRPEPSKFFSLDYSGQSTSLQLWISRDTDLIPKRQKALLNSVRLPLHGK